MKYTWFRQSGFLFEVDDKKIYIDPFELKEGELIADVILITHAHFDHYDPDSIDLIRTRDTVIYAPGDVAAKIPGAGAVTPGIAFNAHGINIETVPAYNCKPERLSFHPKENGWVGYVMNLGDKTVYHAGDTDNTPEMKGIEADLALLPIGGTYTMDASEAGEAAKIIRPADAAVPMHYGAVVGGKKDVEEFINAAAPVRVEVKEPKYPPGPY